jgi:predicted dithiol-disulfide oxidoreductase (DUF899 family)
MSDEQVQAFDEKCGEIGREMMELRKKLQEMLPQRPLETVEDYELKDERGAVRLSELFGDQEDLVVIHNMGKGCPMCTTWADGFNGLLPHFEQRMSLVLSSPDEPDVQHDFARSRHWHFRMVSIAGTSFADDLGFAGEHDGKHMLYPGLSVFRKDGEHGLRRVARDYFGPGDVYCPLFATMELLPGGQGDWWPSLSYD